MRSWHIAFLGLREFPPDLTEFELAFFFSYSTAKHAAIVSRRGDLYQLAAAIHIGFIKMTGRMLDSFEMIPRPLLEHLGDTLGIAVPTLASLRALYSRRSTLFEHRQWAAEIVGFQSLTVFPTH